AARVVALPGPFEFDYLRAQIAKHLPAVRPGQNARGIENAQTAQGGRWIGRYHQCIQNTGTVAEGRLSSILGCAMSFAPSSHAWVERAAQVKAAMRRPMVGWQALELRQAQAELA